MTELQKKRLSYAILLHNEKETFQRLIEHLYSFSHDFEVRVVLDGEHHGMIDLLEECSLKYPNFYYYKRSLNKNFSAQRNFIGQQCKGEYIVRLDADELMPVYFLENVSDILQKFHDQKIDVARMPRINFVGDVPEDIKKRERIVVNEKGWANFPDMQTKIYKNLPHIQWIYSVQEQLTGWTQVYDFPPEEKYAIWHHKPGDILSQSNAFYRTFHWRYWEKLCKSLKKRLGLNLLK